MPTPTAAVIPETGGGPASLPPLAAAVLACSLIVGGFVVRRAF
jgi:hypothetical protein